MRWNDDIKKYLKQESNIWKNVIRKNCVILAEVYENESGEVGLAALK
jgi:hypothetical protein